MPPNGSLVGLRCSTRLFLDTDAMNTRSREDLHYVPYHDRETIGIVSVLCCLNADQVNFTEHCYAAKNIVP